MEWILLAILIISAITDLRNRMILNIITFPGIIIGMTYHIYDSGFNGFLFSGKGLLAGIGLLFIPFALGGMGAGDVKLMGTVGSMMGTSFVVNTFIFSAIIGGIMSLYIVGRRLEVRSLVKSRLISSRFLKGTEGKVSIKGKKGLHTSIPYGVAIGLGAICTYLFGEIL